MSLFHHILVRSPITISCDIDLLRYYIEGEEVTQDSIISALADKFDNDDTRNDITDELYDVRDEMERDNMNNRDILKAFDKMSAPELQFFNF